MQIKIKRMKVSRKESKQKQLKLIEIKCHKSPTLMFRNKNQYRLFRKLLLEEHG
jgi:hypothetical protein